MITSADSVRLKPLITSPIGFYWKLYGYANLDLVLYTETQSGCEYDGAFYDQKYDEVEDYSYDTITTGWSLYKGDFWEYGYAGDFYGLGHQYPEEDWEPEEVDTIERNWDDYYIGPCV